MRLRRVPSILSESSDLKSLLQEVFLHHGEQDAVLLTCKGAADCLTADASYSRLLVNLSCVIVALALFSP